jgi:hypothetical protein
MECVHPILSKQQDGIDVEIRQNAESPIVLDIFKKIYY